MDHKLLEVPFLFRLKLLTGLIKTFQRVLFLVCQRMQNSTVVSETALPKLTGWAGLVDAHHSLNSVLLGLASGLRTARLDTNTPLELTGFSAQSAKLTRRRSTPLSTPQIVQLTELDVRSVARTQGFRARK